MQHLAEEDPFEGKVVVEVLDDDLTRISLTLLVDEGILFYELCSLNNKNFILSGVHSGAIYKFEVTLNERRFLDSEDHPTIYCRSDILHPNIMEGEVVCVNLLKEDWVAGLRLHFCNFILRELFRHNS